MSLLFTTTHAASSDGQNESMRLTLQSLLNQLTQMQRFLSVDTVSLTGALVSFDIQPTELLSAEQSSENRQDLMDKRFGFGKSADGGFNGDSYVVTSLEDSGVGTLRYALESEDKLWITFAVEGEIFLETGAINVKPYKTIDGRLSEIAIKNHGLNMVDTHDIIITGVAILDGSEDADEDAIRIMRSNDIWIDHVTLSNFTDGLLDITRGLSSGTRVTVSNTLFDNHSKVALVGLDSHGLVAGVSTTDPYGDRKIMVTYSGNYFTETTIQRHPRVTQAYVHYTNNIVHWSAQYGLASFEDARVFSEKNWYIAPDGNPNIKKATKYFHGGRFLWGEPDLIPDGAIRSEGDSAENGAIINVKNPQRVSTPSYTYSSVAATEANKAIVAANVGAGYDGTSVVLQARNVNQGGVYDSQDLVFKKNRTQIRIEWKTQGMNFCVTTNLTSRKIISRQLNRSEANIIEPKNDKSVEIKIECSKGDGVIVSDKILITNQ